MTYFPHPDSLSAAVAAVLAAAVDGNDPNLEELPDGMARYTAGAGPSDLELTLEVLEEYSGHSRWVYREFANQISSIVHLIAARPLTDLEDIIEMFRTNAQQHSLAQYLDLDDEDETGEGL